MTAKRAWDMAHVVECLLGKVLSSNPRGGGGGEREKE
jgi:hypothetical protein